MKTTPTTGGEINEAQERERFEAKFPMIAGVERFGDGYAVKDSYANSYACDRYIGRWTAWLAAKADAKLADGQLEVAQEAVVAGPWTANEVGNLHSDDFKHDVTLMVSGDFANKDERRQYGQALAAQLNATPTTARAEAVKLTHAELSAIARQAQIDFCLDKAPSYDLAFADGIVRAFAEKNGLRLAGSAQEGKA